MGARPRACRIDHEVCRGILRLLPGTERAASARLETAFSTPELASPMLRASRQEVSSSSEEAMTLMLLAISDACMSQDTLVAYGAVARYN